MTAFLKLPRKKYGLARTRKYRNLSTSYVTYQISYCNFKHNIIFKIKFHSKKCVFKKLSLVSSRNNPQRHTLEPFPKFIITIRYTRNLLRRIDEYIRHEFCHESGRKFVKTEFVFLKGWNKDKTRSISFKT